MERPRWVRSERGKKPRKKGGATRGGRRRIRPRTQKGEGNTGGGGLLIRLRDSLMSRERRRSRRKETEIEVEEKKESRIVFEEVGANWQGHHLGAYKCGGRKFLGGAKRRRGVCGPLAGTIRGGEKSRVAVTIQTVLLGSQLSHWVLKGNGQNWARVLGTQGKSGRGGKQKAGRSSSLKGRPPSDRRK